MLIVWIILGILIGTASDGPFGGAVGGLIAWLVVRSLRQQREISSLQQALRAMPARAEAAAPTVDPTAAASSMPHGAGADLVAPAAAFSQTIESPDTTVNAPSAMTSAPVLESEAPAFTREADPAIDAQYESARPSSDPLAPLKRWLFGGNTIVKAGVGILFIGLAFLAKYASEHVHLPIEFRLAAIGAVAIALLAVGWRLRLARPGYAQVVQGGAVAVLYLTLFVAFRFYGVLAAGPVFALLVLVAALAAALAVLQDAASLAIIGAIGGFATPLLVSTGSSNYVALFSYYLVLDLGIAAVAWHKTWRTLNLVGFVGTFLIATLWGVLKYRPDDYASAQAFLIAYFLLFNAILLMPARRHETADSTGKSRSEMIVSGSLLFGLPTICFVLQYGLVRDTEYGTALSALVLAGFYVLLATWMRGRPRLAVAFEGSLAVGTVFLTLVIPFALDARSTAGAWALEGAGLVWLGFRQSRVLARLFGYALLVLAALAMSYGQQRYGMPTAIFNATLFNLLVAGVAWLAAAYFVHRALGRPRDGMESASGEKVAEPALIAGGTVWLLSAAGVQIENFVLPLQHLAAWLAVISLIAFIYVELSHRLEWPMIAWPAMAHAPLLAVGVAISAATFASPVQGGGAWAWPVALAAHGYVLWRGAPRWPDSAKDAIHGLGALIVAALGALQGRAITADWGDPSSAWAWLGWLAVPAALLMWLPRPESARRWPISAAPVAYQSAAAGVLTAGLLLWTLLANLISDGTARPLPHVPFLNPLDVGIGIALLASWLWLRSAAAGPLLLRWPNAALILISIAGFVWINAVLVRAFHHYAEVPYYFNAWMRSQAVQTGITLLWTVTALLLMWQSARRTARAPWIVGAVLLAAVVVKLVLIDQAGAGTVERIVSFIGVGVLMLVIGYVAPLPAPAKPHVAA